jgi:cytochrome c oxidase subunit 2
MGAGFPLFPQAASTMATDVDRLYLFLVALTAFFSLLIAFLVIYFAIRYRRVSEDEIPSPIAGSMKLEAVWTAIPMMIALFIFFWGAGVYLKLYRPPAGAIDLYVVGKQWMWKIQHADGQREINELHIPVGRPVRLTMGSEDVIHSFFVPAFRTKADVVPGKFTTLWFQATKPGRYHLFCAEYCGTRHSGMIGWVVAQEPAAYQSWLAGGVTGESLAEAGLRRFGELACNTCHKEEPGARGPSLNDLYMSTVRLADGGTVVANEGYLRESILNPRARLVAGYNPVMPTFQGQVSEEGLLQLLAYIKSLSKAASAPAGAAPAPAPHSGAAPPPAGKVTSR